jgi:hypothetical protein
LYASAAAGEALMARLNALTASLNLPARWCLTPSAKAFCAWPAQMTVAGAIARAMDNKLHVTSLAMPLNLAPYAALDNLQRCHCGKLQNLAVKRSLGSG